MAAASITAQTQHAHALARVHAALVSDGSIQWALPVYRAPVQPAWLKPLLRFLNAVAPYVGYLFWALVAGGLLVIAFLIARELLPRHWSLARWFARRRVVTATPEPEWHPDSAAARTLLSEADALAEAGRYDEAVRLLLRRSVEEIGTRLPRFLRPSSTARDIASDAALPDRARAAFGTIAVVTEAAVFARAGLDAGGWRRARDAYAEFALGQSWRTHAI